MSIPDYQTIMLPLLQFLGDGKEKSMSESVDNISQRFKLSDDEKSLLLPSGKQTVISNRVGWAKTYMKKAMLIDSPRRGFFCITERGKKVLFEKPKGINVKYLEQFKEFVDFREIKTEPLDNTRSTSPLTPMELLENGYLRLRNELAGELLRQIKQCTPGFFEKLVIDLLLGMGYGGSFKDAGKAIGQSGDGGIDGIIKEDKLGLDVIYVQAKRWENVVGRPEIQKFAGALLGQKARKGVFITTSGFTKDAREYVGQVDSKIILIDGETLADQMIDYGVGVANVTTYQIKKIDIDYFSEE